MRRLITCEPPSTRRWNLLRIRLSGRAGGDQLIRASPHSAHLHELEFASIRRGTKHLGQFGVWIASRSSAESSPKVTSRLSRSQAEPRNVGARSSRQHQIDLPRERLRVPSVEARSHSTKRFPRECQDHSRHQIRQCTLARIDLRIRHPTLLPTKPRPTKHRAPPRLFCALIDQSRNAFAAMPPLQQQALERPPAGDLQLRRASSSRPTTRVQSRHPRPPTKCLMPQSTQRQQHRSFPNST